MVERFNSSEDIEFDKKALGRGCVARSQRCNINSNPYKEGTLKFKSWNAGWADRDMILIRKQNKKRQFMLVA